MSDSYALDHEKIKKDEEDYVKRKQSKDWDVVELPKHYNSHPSGVECIEITEHMNFCLGNAMKYLWRSDHKNGLEDLKKSIWYIQREISRREKEQNNGK